MLYRNLISILLVLLFCIAVGVAFWISEVLEWTGKNKEALAGFASLFTIAGTVLAIVIFNAGLVQYNQSERWKRTEFLAKLYRDFSEDSSAIGAMWMIDGDTRIIYFEEGDKQQPYQVNLSIIGHALRRYEPGKEFSAIDLHIRDCFDVFFVYLEQFDRAIENGLLDKDEVFPYFGYWIENLNQPNDDQYEEKLRLQILDYVQVIGYKHVQRFLARWAA